MKPPPGPTGRPSALLTVATALLLLAGCSSQTSSIPPSPSPSAAPRSDPADDAPQYRFDAFQLQAALQTTYRRQALEVSDFFVDLRSLRLRDDPLEGLKVEPESCREMIRSGGYTPSSVTGFRSDTPAAIGDAPIAGAGEGAFVNAILYELTGAEADRYQNLRVHSAPECQQITLEPGAMHASIVERSLDEFGVGSRYIVRSYPKAGKPWVERMLFFRASGYAGEVKAYGPVGSEADFLAFARTVRDRAAQKLK
ncbi:hypothetical protein OHA70_14630 [Kribbella sp. NBC_00382]|uniref:hypothetical protein n=1 Tax=Kribbella sp. NBC_00382 TaxID=2975967 RepID=UPI002E1E56E0